MEHDFCFVAVNTYYTKQIDQVIKIAHVIITIATIGAHKRLVGRDYYMMKQCQQMWHLSNNITVHLSISVYFCFVSKVEGLCKMNQTI